MPLVRPLMCWLFLPQPCGEDAKAIMPDRITPKARVNVVYVMTDEGVNIGQSVRSSSNA